MDFQPVRQQRYSTLAQSQKDYSESKYWRKFKDPIFIKSYAAVNHVHISPTAPHRYAVTTGTRVQIYSPKTARVVKTINRFKDTARCGTIRDDGKLVIAGDDGGLIQVFDINSRAILRTIRDHKQPVHTTHFSPGTATSILSTSDDTTVRLFDLSTSDETSFFDTHTDYVRTGCFLPSNPSLVLSGSYDRTIKLWDSRAGEGQSQAMSLDHGFPVESVIVHPSGTIALSAGGPVIKVWDLVSGSPKCLRAMSNHQKTITSLAWDGEYRRVLSAGLDGLVKVYEGAEKNWRVGHTMRYGGQILSLALSPTDTQLIVGAADGALTIRKRAATATELAQRAANKLASRTVANDARLAGRAQTGIHSGPDAQQGLDVFRPKADGDNKEIKVTSKKRRKLAEWDRALKSFRYADALDAVLVPNVDPALTFALLLELIHREALPIALSARDEFSLEPILRFLIKNTTDPRFGVIACDVANTLIDLYQSVVGQSSLTDDLFAKLRRTLTEELAFQEKLIGVRGALEMVFNSASLSV
ncbi:uncharacterized protein L969DRAFT_84667 [Mixia osmundae IAM 14324]|uniref:U3 small nucleolar RNA-associated protein 15 C-terminal domain-containing protein n=1 Tax=Mixia osmundae (strain CBS 9802 / IAM 14324 / JCM 22182 / KY 12970) TaxID=764103 RepID=G7DTN9_MIXOS|nr:uncharacterized protein L969DRAFT_84667 [Mixia osmundae IAM 14324]KEI42780.1 hypothetical protein L969DRAFT_84667 [Mixia osmundae IAM 14324]GAA93886.1 hypothetical protein E5Q_00532 [Mixia osmundae IAM 14324]